jgi:hypothetical protein
MDPISLISGALGALAVLAAKGAVGAYFKSKGANRAKLEDEPRLALLTERAKNLATKEDVAELTRLAEQTRADVARGSFEHQTRFARTHEKRAEVIADVYRASVEAQQALAALTFEWEAPGAPTKEQLAVIAFQKIEEFSTFEARGIFLPSEVLPVLRQLKLDMLKIVHGFGAVYRPYHGGQPRGAELAQWAALRGHATRGLDRVREVLQLFFRKELGEDVDVAAGLAAWLKPSAEPEPPEPPEPKALAPSDAALLTQLEAKLPK